MLPRRHRPVSRRAFQAVALATLPLPIAATWCVAPSLPHPAAGTDLALPLRALAVVLTLLGFVLLWALVLLPLRRRSRMPTLPETLARAGVPTVGALYARERADLDASRDAADPARRRSYHLRMLAGAVTVALLAGGAAALLWASRQVVLEVVLAAVVRRGPRGLARP
ncbi:MAG: hypothetical protein U0325_05050 [Polyangiales bacterium]